MLELKKEVFPLLLLVMVAWSAVLESKNCVVPPAPGPPIEYW